MVEAKVDRRSIWRLAAALLVGVQLAALVVAVRADERRYTAQVFLDRARPKDSVMVFDFRINESLAEQGGLQQFPLRSPDGTYLAPFDAVKEVEFVRYLGTASDLARYQSRVLFRDNAVRTGIIEMRMLRGTASGMPWHQFLTTRDDRGARLHKIVFVD